MSSDKEENIRYQAGLEEELKNIIRKIDGVLDADVQISFPSTEALPSIQPVTSFASFIRVGAHVESSLRSDNFPALSTFAKQATSPNNNNNSSSNSNNNNSNNNSLPRRRDPPGTAIAYIASPAAPVHVVAQPGPNQVVYAPTPRAPPTPQITTTARPVYPTALVRQGQRQGQKRPYTNQRHITPPVEPLSVIFPKVTSLLRLPKIRPPSNPLLVWYHANLFCNYHRVVGHSTDSCFTLRGIIQDLIERSSSIIHRRQHPHSHLHQHPHLHQDQHPPILALSTSLCRSILAREAWGHQEIIPSSPLGPLRP